VFRRRTNGNSPDLFLPLTIAPMFPESDSPRPHCSSAMLPQPDASGHLVSVTWRFVSPSGSVCPGIYENLFTSSL